MGRLKLSLFNWMTPFKHSRLFSLSLPKAMAVVDDRDCHAPEQDKSLQLQTGRNAAVSP